jgi:hypothetical protein
MNEVKRREVIKYEFVDKFHLLKSKI